ncbi:host cell division inhibitor Icd-like protein, partial [Glaesserella parasuis]|nr:host cell division inhibitor Icd-like protein [Glaesserella parasuis]
VENISLYKMLSEIYSAHVVAKSTTEPENSNDLYLANSTPQACFFIRSTRTPKENTAPKNRESGFLSMVACNGKGFALCCVPSIAVSQPVTRYRPNPEKFSGSLHKSYLELLAMIYKFLCLNRTKHTYNQETLYIQADSEEQARLQLSADYRLLLDRPIAKFRANQTACPTPEQNNSLPKVSRYGYDDCTTTYEGNRNPNTSGIFLSQIYTSLGKHCPKSIEFAVRLISRDKPSNRTNKASYSYVAVETLSHPIKQGDISYLSLTKTYDTMKKPTQTPSGNTARNVSIALSFATKGGVYA